ncbi:hypothetical protein MLP_44220 [Microlunatus phosphovorus NM-1]|uniref:Uncharacterized protein n=1 Tax=Microlunatus phosphovorus (strain ATCC 700054 / DSM 10555 / JCM 9379 / NBRC 101784 / NCIMB 13414 / VKM Ac-1990 / NM-1) TaxID=1032480 RepID=F5XTI7_MICPN|nr:hypothetical protein [Microlunatus phosphovorus]BAK37436.1 hypothetical protein MLP_44220 [Microlunatus phosphovorus NM-1]
MDAHLAWLFALAGGAVLIVGALMILAYRPAVSGLAADGTPVSIDARGIRPAVSMGIIAAGALTIGLAPLLTR